MTDATIGIDVGTSSVKVVLVDLAGQVLAEANEPYSHTHPYPGWSEQDPREWWSQTQKALRRCVQLTPVKNSTLRIHGIGVTGQMHTVVLIDQHGDVVRPAITWLDTRAKELTPQITETLSQHHLLQRINNLPAPGLSISILTWLARHEPTSLERASSFILPKDYIRMQLAGNVASDPTDASGTLLFDATSRDWLGSAAKALGIPTRLFVPLSESFLAVGEVSPQVLGLETSHPPIPIATGSADQQAAALANNVIEPGTIQLMLGTGAQIAAPVKSATSETIDTLNFFAHHRDWLVQGSVQNAGSALTWVMTTLNASWDELTLSMSKPRSLEDPFFLPYLSGERTPIMRPDATGTWVGLRNDVSRVALLRASLEGIAFGVADALETVLSLPEVPDAPDIRVSGGGIRLLEYVKLISSAVRIPFSLLQESNVTGIGAAILGSVAAGVFTNLSTATAAQGVKNVQVVEPEHSQFETINQRRTQFHEIRGRYLAK